MKIHNLFLLFIISTRLFSQNNQSFDSYIENDSINCVMVGEDHRRNNANIKFEILKNLYLSNQINSVYIEYPKAFQIILDSFFLSNKEHTLNEISHFQISDDQIEFLKKIRQEFKSDIEIGKLKIFCFDINASQKPIEDIKKLIGYFPSDKLENLRSILSDFPKEQSSELKCINHLIQEIDSDSNYYQIIFNKYFDILRSSLDEHKMILETPHPFFNFDIDYYREKTLATNINSQFSTEFNKMIIFTGLDHISQTSQDYYSNEDHRTIPSLYELLILENNIKVKRFNLIFLPHKLFRVLNLDYYERQFIWKNWKKRIKSNTFLIEQTSNLSELKNFNNLSDYTIIVNKRKM